jgi:hypothetical protein
MKQASSRVVAKSQQTSTRQTGRIHGRSPETTDQQEVAHCFCYASCCRVCAVGNRASSSSRLSLLSFYSSVVPGMPHISASGSGGNGFFGMIQLPDCRMPKGQERKEAPGTRQHLLTHDGSSIGGLVVALSSFVARRALGGRRPNLTCGCLPASRTHSKRIPVARTVS